MIKLFIVILAIILLILHILFLTTNFYGNCQKTGNQECKICIINHEQKPCKCEDMLKCTNSLESFIIPIILIFLCILNFSVKET